MFTGIITHIGTIKHIEKSGDWQFTIAVPGFTRDLAIGASIACNGVCLTVISKDIGSFTVQVSHETLARTTLGSWQEDGSINLERALKVGDELGGHFVSGHVDGLARIENITRIGESKEITLSVIPCESTGSQAGDPAVKQRDDRRPLYLFIAEKGSVTLDGVSLTVNEVAEKYFSVNIISHTLQQTTLGERKKGDAVNLEIDIIARYLVRIQTT